MDGQPSQRHQSQRTSQQWPHQRMAHHLPHMMAAADEVEEGTPGENVAVDAEDEEEQHHQRLACHPQQSAAFHHQRVEDEQQPPTQTSGSIIGTIVTLAGTTLRHGITARRAPKAIAKRGTKRDAPRSSVVHTWRQATGPAKADSTKTCYQQTRRRIRRDRQGQRIVIVLI